MNQKEKEPKLPVQKDPPHGISPNPNISPSPNPNPGPGGLTPASAPNR